MTDEGNRREHVSPSGVRLVAGFVNGAFMWTLGDGIGPKMADNVQYATLDEAWDAGLSAVFEGMLGLVAELREKGGVTDGPRVRS